MAESDKIEFNDLISEETRNALLTFIGDVKSKIKSISAETASLAGKLPSNTTGGIGGTDKAKKEMDDLTKSVNILEKAHGKLSEKIATNKEIAAQLNAETKQQAKLNTLANDSLKAMEIELAKMRNQYASLTDAQRNNWSVGGQLLKSIQSQDTAIKSVRGSMGQYQANVGNYIAGQSNLKVKVIESAKAFSGMAGMLDILGRLVGVNVDQLMALKEIHSTLRAASRDLTHIKTEETVATEAHTEAVEAETVATGMSTGGILLLIAGVVAAGAAVYEYISSQKEEKEAVERTTKELEDQTKQQEALTASIKDYYSYKQNINSYQTNAAQGGGEVEKHKIRLEEIKELTQNATDIQNSIVEEALFNNEKIKNESDRKEREVLRENGKKLQVEYAKQEHEKTKLIRETEEENARFEKAKIDKYVELVKKQYTKTRAGAIQEAKDKELDEEDELRKTLDRKVDQDYTIGQLHIQFRVELKKINDEWDIKDDEARKKYYASYNEAIKKALEKYKVDERNFNESEKKKNDTLRELNIKREEFANKLNKELHKDKVSQAKIEEMEELDQLDRLYELKDRKSQAYIQSHAAIEAIYQKKINNERIDEALKTEEAILSGLSQGLAKRESLQQASDQRMIDFHTRTAGIQATLAAGGKANTLGAEQAAAAQAEEKKIQDAKKAAKVQQAIALVDTFSKVFAAAMKASDGSPGSFMKAFAQASAADGLVSAAFSKLFTGFYDGTESLGESDGVKIGEGKDNMLIRAHKGERILGVDDSAAIAGLSNEEVRDASLMYMNGLYVPKTIFVDKKAEENAVLIQEVRALKEAFVSRPVHQTRLDGLKEWTEEINEGNMTTIIHHKPETFKSLRLR